MYLEEETDKKSEMISCIFSLKEEVGALAKALRLFEVTGCLHTLHNVTPPPLTYSQFPLSDDFTHQEKVRFSHVNKRMQGGTKQKSNRWTPSVDDKLNPHQSSH